MQRPAYISTLSTIAETQAIFLRLNSLVEITSSSYRFCMVLLSQCLVNNAIQELR